MEDELAQWERCHAPAAPRGAICSAELSSCRAWPNTAAGSVATTVRMYTLPRKHTCKTDSLVQRGLHMCRRANFVLTSMWWSGVVTRPSRAVCSQTRTLRRQSKASAFAMQRRLARRSGSLASLAASISSNYCALVECSFDCFSRRAVVHWSHFRLHTTSSRIVGAGTGKCGAETESQSSSCCWDSWAEAGSVSDGTSERCYR